MEPLEDSLKKVEGLRKDLSATKPESFIPPFQYPSDGCMALDSREVADTERREAAKTQLQQIYDNSKWDSVRYVAGNLIGEDAARNVKNWYANLEKRLGATRTEEREVREWHQEEEMASCGKGGSDTRDTSHWESVLKTFEIIDTKTRKNALTDAIQLLRISNLPEIQELLKNEYSNNTSDHVRVEAGKALGYSNLRILAHEHPVIAAITGIATIGVVSSLGYILARYFNR